MPAFNVDSNSEFAQVMNTGLRYDSEISNPSEKYDVIKSPALGVRMAPPLGINTIFFKKNISGGYKTILLKDNRGKVTR